MAAKNLPPDLPTPPDPITLDCVSSSYRKLSLVAADLNAVSDELGKSISTFDNALKKLNLGVSTWLTVQEWHDQSGEYYSNHQIGYAKVGSKWGIALSTAEGNYSYPDGEKSEIWLFNEAPRSLRIEAIDKIPDLLEKLIKEAESMITKVKAKLSQAQQFAETINQVASEVSGKRK